jgi:hypothetical protein
MADLEAIADTLVENHLEDAIAAAQDAGDHEKAQDLYLKSQGVDSPGDDAAEQGDDAAESSDIGPPPDGEWTFDRPEVVDHQFAVMEAAFGDLATELREEWGDGAGTNLVFASAAAREFADHYPEVVQTIENRGAGDDPLIVEILAVLGRQWAETPGDPRTVRLFPGTGNHEQERNMNEIDANNFDEQTETLMTESEEAAQQGNLAKRDRIEKQLRALFVRRYGTGPAIGSSGGPTA